MLRLISLLFCVLLCIGIVSAQPQQPTLSLSEERPAWSFFFDQQQVTGAFVLYDVSRQTFVRYNPTRCSQGFLPASTFKIYNSLIGLDTGVITDEQFTLTWDGIDRGNAAWNRDQTMQSAFKNSTVWYYQVIARRIGEKRMAQFLAKLAYGNQDITAGIDKFWLEGAMRITPDAQVALLTKLVNEEIPFSPRALQIVKRLMILEQTSDYTLRGKTGTTTQDGKRIGWLVGYLERDGKTYLYALNIEDENTPASFSAFNTARFIITRKILHDYGLLPTE